MAADAIFDFFGQVVESIWKNLFFLILLAVPLIVIFVFGERLTDYAVSRVPLILTIILCAATALNFVLGSFIVAADRSDYGYLFYYNHPTDKETPMYFGLLTAYRLNLN